MHSFPRSKIGLAPSTGPLNCTIGSKPAPACCAFGAGQYKDAVDGALVSERADQDRAQLLGDREVLVLVREIHSSENMTRKHYVQKTHEAPDNTSLIEAFGN